MTDTSTDQTYLVTVRAEGAGFKTYEVQAPNVTMAMHFARDLAATAAGVSFSRTHAADVTLKPLPDLACGTCGEREGSTYARRCCMSDTMVEV